MDLDGLDVSDVGTNSFTVSGTLVIPVGDQLVFGPEDDFFNRFAEMARFAPALPLIGGGTMRFQPVYVGDVVQAILAILADPARDAIVYELGGPRAYTFRELLEKMLAEMGIRRLFVPIPFFVAGIQAGFLEFLPVPPLTRDQVALLKQDNILGGDHPGLAELGIEATPLEAILPTYIGSR